MDNIARRETAALIEQCVVLIEKEFYGRGKRVFKI